LPLLRLSGFFHQAAAAAELRIDVLDQLLLTSRLRRMIGVIPAAALL
jgi:hypothetical protein